MQTVQHTDLSVGWAVLEEMHLNFSYCTEFRDLSRRANYTDLPNDRSLSAELVQTFTVSVTDP
jgi:hypothetical protein